LASSSATTVVAMAAYRPGRRKLRLFAGHGEAVRDASLALGPDEAWIDLGAGAWRRVVARADRLADELAAGVAAPGTSTPPAAGRSGEGRAGPEDPTGDDADPAGTDPDPAT
jgi:hypothetical protein